MNKQISKEEKVEFLKDWIDFTIRFASYCELPEDEEMFNSHEDDYFNFRSLLFDYSPEEAEKFSDDFLAEVNKNIDEINLLIEEGKY